MSIAAVGVTLGAAKGRVTDARIAVAGGGGGPMRAARAEGLMAGRSVDAALLGEIAQAVDGEIAPTGDLQVSAEYRRHLIGVLVQRAVRTAWRRANGEAS
mgnify:CR=1 FL=1